MKDILSKINQDQLIAVKLLFILTCVYVILSSRQLAYLKAPIICLGILLFLYYKNKDFRFYSWITLFSILLIDFCVLFYYEANHHFLLVYTNLLIILYLCNVYTIEIVLKNAKFLIVIVLFFAALQKLFSPQFITGDYYYYILNTGNFFKPFLKLMPDAIDKMNENRENINSLNLKNPNDGSFIILKDIFPHLQLFSVLFAWVTIIFEFIVALAFLIKPRHKFTHLLMIILIIGVFITRLETGFLSLLSILGLLVLDNNNSKLKFIYVALILLFITLVITRLGYQ